LEEEEVLGVIHEFLPNINLNNEHYHLGLGSRMLNYIDPVSIIVG
jgi:hypothetical protein